MLKSSVLGRDGSVGRVPELDPLHLSKTAVLGGTPITPGPGGWRSLGLDGQSF